MTTDDIRHVAYDVMYIRLLVILLNYVTHVIYRVKVTWLMTSFP